MVEGKTFIPDQASFLAIVSALTELWPETGQMLGILLFGSRAKFEDQKKGADWDIGVIYDGERPVIQIPDDWDLFFWSRERWLAGFALQVEIARHGIILADPEGLIKERFEMIRERILPFWAGYLKRF